MKTLLKLILTLAAFWLAFRNVSWSELADAWARQQPVYLIAAACAILLQIACGGIRWHHVRSALEPGPHNATRTTLFYYASNFFNVCFPSTVGSDIARGWLAKRDGGHVKDIIYSVIVDRLLSLLGLLLIVITTLPTFATYIGIGHTTGLIITILCWVLFVGGYALSRAILALLKGLIRIAVVQNVISALEKMLVRYVPMACALFWSAGAHLAYATAGYALALSLGIDISWYQCVVLIPLVLLISTLPISLGGWGIREMSMAGLLALIGIAPAPSLLLALQLGLITTLLSLFGGVYYFVMKRK